MIAVIKYERKSLKLDSNQGGVKLNFLFKNSSVERVIKKMSSSFWEEYLMKNEMLVSH